MKTTLIKVFRYLEPLWLGNNDKVSIRRVLAIAFSWDFITNISFAIQKFEIGKSYSDVALLLGLEAGLIAALLTLTTYSNANVFNKTVGNNSTETIQTE
jgi:hypothetical protein